MNGLDKILAKIKADANAEKEKLIRSAISASAKIDTETESQIKDIEEICSIRRKERDSRTLSIAKSNGERLKKQIILKTKRRLLDNTFSMAEDHLCKQSPEQYTAFLIGLIDHSIQNILHSMDREVDLGVKPVCFTVKFNEKDTARYSASVLKELASQNTGSAIVKADKSIAHIKGGAIVLCGDIEMNCSIEAIVEAKRSSLEAHAADILFSKA
ncbi:MAG: V-type ATP synthase subunit E [Clostridia bacterium]|nr:V-type ATP synthase subunit E [Clostridia bacterium]